MEIKKQVQEDLGTEKSCGHTTRSVALSHASSALVAQGQKKEKTQIHVGEVPAEEGAVHRRGCGERGDVARRVPAEHRDVDQLLGLVAEEELEQREDPPHQEHDGEVLPHPRLSGMSG